MGHILEGSMGVLYNIYILVCGFCENNVGPWSEFYQFVKLKPGSNTDLQVSKRTKIVTYMVRTT